MMTCRFFILSAVVIQSSVIRKAPSAPVLFRFSSGDNESSSSSPFTISSECREAAAILETLEQVSLNSWDCKDETASQYCVVGIPKAIAVCYKDLAIASDCVQEMFDVSKILRILRIDVV